MIDPINQKIFALEAKKYSEDEYWRYDEDLLVNKYFIKKGSSLLILGCGAGRTIKPLTDKGFKITAIDIVPEMVAQAQERCAGLGATILEMDAAKLSFPNNTFDYVFFPFHGIDYVLPDKYAVANEATRVLKPGGIFIFNSHNQLFVKDWKNMFKKTTRIHGIITNRSTFLDRSELEKYFGKVEFVARISLQPETSTNWKDKIYQLMPWLDKSIYFICHKSITVS